MGTLREQPESEILQPDDPRPPRAARGKRELGPLCHGHRQGHERRRTAGLTTMTDTPVWRRYLRFLRADVHADVDDELQFHIDMIAAGHAAAGLPPDEARARALDEFG